jgi:hypothetical protein
MCSRRPAAGCCPRRAVLIKVEAVAHAALGAVAGDEDVEEGRPPRRLLRWRRRVLVAVRDRAGRDRVARVGRRLLVRVLGLLQLQTRLLRMGDVRRAVRGRVGGLEAALEQVEEPPLLVRFGSRRR